ncbi:HEAT repeat domain-containing protein [Nitratiruptor tergarcus]|nr:HEAT repeat domain-containing protein [Nitratiruptor tergarcus]
MKGLLNVRFYGHDSNGTIALMQLSNLSLDLGNPEIERILKKVYSQMFVVHFTADGHIFNYTFKGNDEDSKGLQQLISEFQIVLKQMPDYTTEENTADGTVYAQYKRDEILPCFLKKQRHGFYINKQQSYKKNIIKSDANATIAKSWIETFDSKEIIEVVSGTKKISEYVKQISLTKVEQPIDNTLDIWRYSGDINNLIEHYKNDSEESYIKKASKEAAKKYIKQNRISLDSLLLSIKGKDPQQLMKIAEYLKLFPDEATKLLPFIKSADYKMAADLIFVLQRAGTVQAQLVLQKIVQDTDYKQVNRIRAIIALGGVKEPSEDTINFLWQIQSKRDSLNDKRLSDTALLNIGRFGKNSPYADEIKAKLSELAQNIPNDSSEKRILLLSMKNADAQYFESDIVDALRSSNPRVRSAAVKALSKLNKESVRDELLPLFTTDEDLEVRQQLAKTLLTIDPNGALMSRARENILKEDDSLVRKNLILYLLKYREKYPENDNILKKLRKIERDKNNQILLIKNGY